MVNANIDALYAGSLRIKISYLFSEKLTFYKWFVTKVAHCRSNISLWAVEIISVCHSFILSHTVNLMHMRNVNKIGIFYSEKISYIFSSD